MLLVQNLLSFTLLLPLFGSFLLLVTPFQNKPVLKSIVLNFSCLTFISSLFIWVFFDKSVGTFQFTEKFLWIPILSINFPLGIDGISLFFVILTTMLIPLCLLASWESVQADLKKYFMAFLIMEFFLIGVFCILDLLLFYIFFESVLIPMYLIVGVWGSRERKIRAAYFFFVHSFRFSFNATIYFIYLLSSRNN